MTANFFRMLGVKPALGRTFLPDEDGIDNPAAASKVAVIGYRFWQDTMGGDPNVLGRTIVLSTIPYAIVGVLPADFQFMSRRHEVCVPISLDRQNRDYHYMTVIGRLQAPRETAAAEMSTIARSLGEQYPKSNQGWTVQVDDFEDWLGLRLRTRLLLLFGAVAMVLLIACANIASLLLARSATRNRELAVRISLGATRARLTRQLLTESVMLALAGGAAGLALAWALIKAAPALIPPDAMPTATPIELNQVVILYTIAIALATGILFGLAPAMAAARPDVQDTLKDSSRAPPPLDAAVDVCAGGW